jgi:hypothetical protein
VDNPWEGIPTTGLRFSTIFWKVGFLKPKIEVPHLAAKHVRFSTGFPHPSHILLLRNKAYFQGIKRYGKSLQEFSTAYTDYLRIFASGIMMTNSIY